MLSKSHLILPKLNNIILPNTLVFPKAKTLTIGSWTNNDIINNFHKSHFPNVNDVYIKNLYNSKNINGFNHLIIPFSHYDNFDYHEINNIKITFMNIEEWNVASKMDSINKNDEKNMIEELKYLILHINKKRGGH
jgi:hypothetical protein